MPGDTGWTSTYVGASPPALERFWTLAAANDRTGKQEMLDSQRVIWFEGELRLIQQAGEWYEVRILEGPYEGLAGWIDEIAAKRLR